MTASLGNAVKFTTPDGVVHSVSPAAATTFTLTNPNFYVRSQDVTSFVTAPGSYITGAVPATQTTSEDNANNAGWTLAVIYLRFDFKFDERLIYGK